MLRYLGTTWALIAVWILGPAILIWMRVRAKKREEAAKKAAAAGGKMPGATPVPKKDRETTAITQVPAGMVAHDVTPGWRDLKWGDAPKDGMTCVSEQEGESVYTRADEELKLEEIPVDAVHYIFSGGQFAAVRIDAPYHAADPLVKALAQHWGTPENTDPRATKVQWPRIITGANATAAVLEKSASTQRTTVFFFRKVERRPSA